MSQRRDYSQPPTGKQSLGEARPTRRKELHAGEAELLPQLIAKLKADPEGLWPLPPKMVIAGDVDATLVRFLRARKGKVPDAAQMLKDTVLWRRTDNVDQAMETCPGAVPMAAIRSGISSAYVCNDYEGVPVYVERSGMLDMNAVLAKGTTVDELVRLHVVSMEYFTQTLCLEASIAQGQTIDKVVSVIDLTGVTMSNASNKHFIALFKQMSKIDSDNYPEVMKSVYIINAPWIFSAIFNLIKGFLDPSTQKKIKVVKPKDLSVLMAPILDMSQIPQCVGGQGANTVLSQPDGSISEAHYKQDYHIESYRMALLDGDPLVGPNCFSYTDDWGEPLYKLCHHSDVGATVDGLAPTPSSPRSSFVEEELVEGMDAEVEEALTVLERAMARVMKLQQQSKTLSAKAGMGISVVPLARHSPRFQLPSDAPKELAEPKLANGHGGPRDSVPRGGCFGCFGGGPR